MSDRRYEDDPGRSIGRGLLMLAGGALVGFGAYMVVRHPLRVLNSAATALLKAQGAEAFDAPWAEGTVRYYMVGSGAEPMVILHGFGDTPGSWARITSALGKRYRICLPVQVGHPGTRAPDDLQLGHAVQALDAAILHAFGSERVHLVGHSLGGWVSAVFAAAASERLRSLTLVNTAGLNETFRDDLLVPRTNDEAVAALRGVLGPSAERIPGFLVDGYRRGMSERAETAVLRMMAEAAVLDEPLGRITAPTRVIGCDKDRLVGLRSSERAASSIPGATLDVIEGGSHVPHMTDVPQLAALLYETADWSHRPRLTN